MLSQIDLWYALAACMALAIFAIHTFIGGPEIAGPLMDKSLPLKDVPRYTNYYCWHLVTITLFAQAAGFAWSAMPGNNPDLGVAATILSIGFLLWNIGLNLGWRLRFATAPQWVFFLPLSVLGLIGSVG